MALRFLKIAAVFVSLMSPASIPASLTVEHSNVVPLKSELSADSYANWSLYTSIFYNSTSSTNSPYSNSSGYYVIKIISVNSTNFVEEVLQYTNGVSHIANSTFTVPYSLSLGFFPYYNSSVIKHLIGNATTSLGNGTYMFQGKRLQMERATINYSIAGNVTSSSINLSIEFDTLSGILLNMTAHQIRYHVFAGSVPVKVSVEYTNTSMILVSTSIALGNVNSSTIESYLIAIAGSIATVAIVASYRKHRKRQM